ncbi:MAG: endonuclease/exonuclease/phosphatase family protein [Bdellovibrionaceae bacterium]|nr:endonuclease/exonuclease/phosphatase family protein [Pseudobdellovibrionaceae bacterium]
MKYKFITFNIHKARSTFLLSNTLMKIKEATDSVPVDFMFIQELVGNGPDFIPKEYASKVSSQIEVLADSIWKDHCYGKNAIFKDRHHGNAILSRFPIAKWENENISTNRWEQRGLLHCEIPLDDGQVLHLFNVHLNLRHDDRVKQVERVISRYLKLIPKDAPFILAGDFNDWGKELSHYLEANMNLFECHKYIKKNYAKTFPSFFPILSLDRIYAKNIKPTLVETLSSTPWNVLSDHLPMYMEFEI